MAIINFAHREIIASIVYFGPPGAGSTTNVLYLYDHLPVEEKSTLHHFAAHNETHDTRFFDYMPIAGGEIKGFTMRVRIYSLPGDIRNTTHRDQILRNIDGIVFVADARQGREADNTRHLLELEASLQEQNIEMASLPFVFQLNRGDGPKTVLPETMNKELNPYGFPIMSCSALKGTGIVETYGTVLSTLIERIKLNLSGDTKAIRLNTIHHGNREDAEDVVRRHINAIRESEASSQDKESIEEATRTRVRKRYAHVKPEAEFTLPWVHNTLGDATPTVILESAVEGNQVRLDLLLRQDGVNNVKRIYLRR